MHYLQAYYHQSYISSQDDKLSSTSPPQNININIATSIEPSKQQHNQIGSNKQSSREAEYCLSPEIKHQGWNNPQSENRFLFLLDNAWQGLYNIGEIADFKNCE